MIPPEQLTSWKAIAEYLGVNIRTAQRWEQERGLPLRRFSGERGRVVAIPEELDRWKSTNLSKQNWWTNLQFLHAYTICSSAAVLILIGIGLGVYVHSRQLGPPARLRVENNEIIVADADGRERWRHAFAEPPYAESIRQRTWFGRLGVRGEIYTLFVNQLNKLANSRLLCFSEQGKSRWEFTPGRPVSDGKHSFPSLYSLNSFQVVPGAKGDFTRIVVSSNHAWSYPDQVAVLDPSGKLVGEYWHAGHLTSMETGEFGGSDSSSVILAGVDNGRHRATLVILDPKNMHGASAEDDDSYKFRGMDRGTERAIVWFERSCINEVSEEFNYATEASIIPEGLQVAVRESHDGSVYVIYVLDKNLNVTYVEVSSGFKTLHRELERTGRLNHKFAESEVEKLRGVFVVRGL